jgi:ABC-2 type transport system permease protein
MRNFWAILKKELHALFTSPIAYVVLAVFFAVTGFFFYIITSNIIMYASQQMLRAQQYGGAAPPIDVTTMVVNSYFGVLSTILLFMVPMITMGVFAEEKKRGTIEFLFTSPLKNSQLIAGKFGAVALMLAVMLIPTVLNLVLLYIYSDPTPSLAPILTGYLGAFLLGSTLLAVGLFVSSLTENQIVAAVLTWGIFIVLWVIDALAGMGTTTGGLILGYVSVLNHYDDFTRGILDTQNLVFYLSLVLLGLYLTSVSLNSVKWRQ